MNSCLKIRTHDTRRYICLLSSSPLLPLQSLGAPEMRVSRAVSLGAQGILGAPPSLGEGGRRHQGWTGNPVPSLPSASYCANLFCPFWGTNVLSIVHREAFPASYSISRIADLGGISFPFSR